MKIIVCANEKGGVGKTTLAMHLAWHFADRGYRTLAIDVDQQGNLSDTLEAFKNGISAASLFMGQVVIPPSPNLVVVHSDRDIIEVDYGDHEKQAQTLRTFAENLVGSSENFDVAVIDTPPALYTLRTVAALYVSDAVVAPVELGEHSITGVTSLLHVIQQISEALERPVINFLGLLPSRFDRRSPGEVARFQVLAENFGEVLFRNGDEHETYVIAKRDAYARAASEKQPVWKMAGSAQRDAATEIRKIMSVIEKRMGPERGGE